MAGYRVRAMASKTIGSSVEVPAAKVVGMRAGTTH
jgi:hypothetical protein